MLDLGKGRNLRTSALASDQNTIKRNTRKSTSEFVELEMEDNFSTVAGMVILYLFYVYSEK